MNGVNTPVHSSARDLNVVHTFASNVIRVTHDSNIGVQILESVLRVA